MRPCTSRFDQKYFFLIIALLAFSVLHSCTLAANKPELRANLVKNNSFEDGVSSWKIPANSAKVVSDVAKTGNHSLYYVNTDESQYKTFTQSVSVKPGDKVRFTAWVKGKGVNQQGRSGGAAIYMESYGGSKFIGGAYPRAMKGTFDWHLLIGEYQVPKDATNTIVGLYIQKGITGTVWFDDVEVRVIEPVPFTSVLCFPNYRGMVKQGDGTPWKVNINADPLPEWTGTSYKIDTTLSDAKGKVLLRDSREANTTEKSVDVELRIPQNLSIGDYTLSQAFTAPDGKIYKDQQPIHVMAQMPKVYIDAQGFTVVDGKRFFPMGIYLGPSSDEDLSRIAEGGFNTILSYSYGHVGKNPEAYMERARKHNLKVIYSLKDLYPGKPGFGENAYDVAATYIERFQNDPQLLAWYTNDELGIEWLDKLAMLYSVVEKLDSEHPTFQILISPTHSKRYFDSMDILGTDPYPVGMKGDLTLTGNFARATKATTRDIKGMWMVPQLMDWSVYRPAYKPHPPSLDEMRNQAYQDLINGATGLIWYSYYDMMFEKYPRNDSTRNMDLFTKRWKDATTMAGEINKITPVVLDNKKVLLDIPTKAEVEAAAWQDGNELLIMLANPYYEEKSISFALPDGWKIKDANQGEIKSTFVNSKATFILPGIGSGVFRLVKN